MSGGFSRGGDIGVLEPIALRSRIGIDLAQHDCQNLPRALVNDLVYADDTLVLAVDSGRAEIQMISTGRAGANYGLCFNWKQVEAMQVRCDVTISKPDGTFVPCKSSMIYLGNVISASGEIAAEVSRRLGAAKADCQGYGRNMEALLPDPPCQTARKICVFNACITSKVLYCLHTAWLNKSELRRLDAFEATCSRKILRIPHSFISRVSNDEVLSRAQNNASSKMLQFRQMMLFKRIADLLPGDIMKTCVFRKDTWELLQPNGCGRRGRPKQRWSTEVFKLIVQMAGETALDRFWDLPAPFWKGRISDICFGA